jgi:hypothetical protein
MPATKIEMMSPGLKRALLIVGGFAILFAFVSPDIETPIFIFKAKMVDAPTVAALTSLLLMMLASLMFSRVFAAEAHEPVARSIEIIPLICSRLC